MARYCVAFESMQRFLGLGGREGLEELLCGLSQCQEFKDIRLRVNEKKVLNTLNKDKNRATIRCAVCGWHRHRAVCVVCGIPVDFQLQISYEREN